MPGIAKAKARQGSKKNKPRQKAGLPAKAGRRRPHNIQKDARGDYIAAPYVAHASRTEPEPRRYMMTHEVPKHYTVPRPQGAALAEGFSKIRKMERNYKHLSDPFLFQRMRTHFVNGLMEI